MVAEAFFGAPSSVDGMPAGEGNPGWDNFVKSFEVCGASAGVCTWPSSEHPFAEDFPGAFQLVVGFLRVDSV